MRKLLLSGFLGWLFLWQAGITKAALTSFQFNDLTTSVKKAGVPFQVVITAKDENSATITSFNGPVTLSDATATIYPTQSEEFTNGVWIGNVYITDATTSTEITADYAAVTSTSGSFEVEADDRIKFLTITAGNNQTGTVYNQLPTALSLKVVDPYDNPIPSVGVNMSITSYPPGATGQTLGSSSATSNVNGLISTTLTLGRKTGTYIVTASLASGITTPINFFETATGDVLITLELTPVVGVMPRGSILPFTAKGYDQFRNEKSLGTVTWSVVNSGGSIDQAGVFTSGNTLGTFLNTIRAVHGNVGTTATVTVVGEGDFGGASPTPNTTATPTPTATPSPTATSTSTSSSSEGVLSDVIIDPDVITALRDARIPIVAEGVDIFGNSLANVNFTFEVSGNLGTLTQTSANTVLLTASESGIGTVTVTAEQGDIVKVAKVVGSVGTGLNRRLVIEDIQSPQQVGEPFTISIAAKDSLNRFLTDYDGPIALADTTGTIDPGIVQPNEQGIWFVQAIISLAHPEVSITAAGDGMIGVSNIFEVQGTPKLSDVPPFGAGAAGGAGAGAGGGLGEVLGASISGKINELLQDKDLNKYTIARFIGAGLAAGMGILGASLGGGIMASRGLEAMGRNPFAKGRLKLNLYISIIAFVTAAGLAVFASFLIVQ